MASNKTKLVFVAEWQEPQGPVPRKFILTYHSQDGTVEMYDVKSRRVFLRRTLCNTIEISNLYIGSKVNVLSRLLTLTEYGDSATRDAIGTNVERSLALVRADDGTRLGRILEALNESGLEIKNLRMFTLMARQESAIQKRLVTPSAFSMFLSLGKLIAIELKGVDSLNKWKNIRSDLNIAETTYGSTERESGEMELQTIFSEEQHSIRCNTAVMQGTTCCIVKPHIIKEGNLGQVIQRIVDADLSVTAMDMVHLDMGKAQEFFEVYRGLIPEYQKTLAEMVSGPSLALEISGTDSQKRLRELVGPHDPEMARMLRSGTLRAHFGKDSARNAVHCTDLPEDALLEVEYFFKISSNNA